MQLHLEKKVNKGMLGGKSLSFKGWIEFSQEETDIIKSWGLENTIVYEKDPKNAAVPKGLAANLAFIAQSSSNKPVQTKVKHLMKGQEYQGDFSELCQHEAMMREACENLKSLMDALEVFEGKEVIEY